MRSPAAHIVTEFIAIPFGIWMAVFGIWLLYRIFHKDTKLWTRKTYIALVINAMILVAYGIAQAILDYWFYRSWW